MIRVLSRYIVTEIKLFLENLVLIKGNEFYNLQTYKFWVTFL